MDSSLKFYDFDSNEQSDCGNVLEIEFSSTGLDWPGIVLEKGSSPHFYPQNVYTPYFYFALGLEKDLHWSAEIQDSMTELHTNPGDVWINPPRTPFSHNISEPCYFIILAVEEQVFLDSCSLNLKGKQLQFLNNYNVHDPTIKGILELFLIEARAGGRNGYTYLKNLLTLLATHYVQNYSDYTARLNEAETSSKFDQHHVDKIDRYIDQHLSSSIAVEDLAELVSCSKFHFLREFKKLTGITPYQYLMDKRLEESKVLLSTNNQSISSVGSELGFSDQAHFTRAFKKQFGMTPGQFQKQIGTTA